jgi:hypothetical protein
MQFDVSFRQDSYPRHAQPAHDDDDVQVKMALVVDLRERLLAYPKAPRDPSSKSVETPTSPRNKNLPRDY